MKGGKEIAMLEIENKSKVLKLKLNEVMRRTTALLANSYGLSISLIYKQGHQSSNTFGALQNAV